MCSLHDAAKVQHLPHLAFRYPGCLPLFEADSMQQCSFDAAMQACGSVVHAAAQHTLQEHDLNPSQGMAQNPYAYSKSQAEQVAWEMQAQQKRWESVTIHSGALFGLSRSRQAGASSARRQAELGQQWRRAAATLNEKIQQIARDGLPLAFKIARYLDRSLEEVFLFH